MNIDKALAHAHEQWNQKVAEDFLERGAKVFEIAEGHDDCECPPCVVAEGFSLYRQALEERGATS